MFTRAVLWLALSAAASGGVATEAGQMPPPHRQPDYVLGPADELAISVVGLDEFRTLTEPWITVTVSNSAKVHVPYAGVIPIRGMTPLQLQSEIERRLRERDLLKEPQVTVRVRTYRSQTIYILGEIMQPGQYYMREEMYLLDLIGLALGFPTEGFTYLYRRAPAPEGVDEGGAATSSLPGETAVVRAMPIDMKALSEGKRPDLNIRLQGGDVLYVPFNKPVFFYATGEVNSPGAFELPPSRDVLASQAVAIAGGPTRTAKMSKGMLVRFDQEGRRQELAIDFDAILKGREPDFPVAPNDIIFIPGSNAKTLGYGLLEIVPNLVTAGLVW